MGRPIVDVTGWRVGNWTVIRRINTTSPTRWLCQCDCGQTRILNGGNLRTRKATKCMKCAVAEHVAKDIKGGIWITDNINNARLAINEPIPDGWREGRIYNSTKGRKYPQLAGDNSPMRIKMEKQRGFKFLPVDNPWRKIANGIWTKCLLYGFECDFSGAQELALYLNEIAPEKCPVFNWDFVFGKGGFYPQSPNVDRIVPSLGYVRNNLQIISSLANSMKHNATKEQLITFSKWILHEYSEENISSCI